MKTFFKDEKGDLSMGRLLSFSLFFICTGVWIAVKMMGKGIDNNDMNLILWGWGISVIGKVGGKFAEGAKK